MINNLDFVEEIYLGLNMKTKIFIILKLLKIGKFQTSKNMEKILNYSIVSKIKSFFMFQKINIMNIIHITKLNAPNAINIFAIAVHQ